MVMRRILLVNYVVGLVFAVAAGAVENELIQPKVPEGKKMHCFMNMGSDKWIVATYKGFVTYDFTGDKAVLSAVVSKGDYGSSEKCEEALPYASKKYEKGTMYCQGPYLFGKITVSSDQSKEKFYNILLPQCKTLNKGK
jgi:hypothetical protein